MNRPPRETITGSPPPSPCPGPWDEESSLQGLYASSRHSRLYPSTLLPSSTCKSWHGLAAAPHLWTVASASVRRHCHAVPASRRAIECDPTRQLGTVTLGNKSAAVAAIEKFSPHTLAARSPASHHVARGLFILRFQPLPQRRSALHALSLCLRVVSFCILRRY